MQEQVCTEGKPEKTSLLFNMHHRTVSFTREASPHFNIIVCAVMKFFFKGCWLGDTTKEGCDELRRRPRLTQSDETLDLEHE